jgi:aryl-alcohol dehydrogenase-like predicted oxidoreductase
MLAGTRQRDGARETTRGGNDAFADELYTDQDFDVVDAVRAVAGERGLPPAQVSLAWLLSKPTVTAPVVGATKLRHIEDAVAATSVALTAEEIARLEAPYRPHEVLPKR